MGRGRLLQGSARAPDHLRPDKGGRMETLTIDLFSPGMSPLHRAGLGGLAATLRWIDDHVQSDRRPPGEWEVGDRRVLLRWDGAEGARPFLQRLYELAFQIDGDGL